MKQSFLLTFFFFPLFLFCQLRAPEEEVAIALSLEEAPPTLSCGNTTIDITISHTPHAHKHGMRHTFFYNAFKPQKPPKKPDNIIRLEKQAQRHQIDFHKTQNKLIQITQQIVDTAQSLKNQPLQQQFSHNSGQLYIQFKQSYYEHINCNDYSGGSYVNHVLTTLNNLRIKNNLTLQKYLARIYTIDAQGITFELLKPGVGTPIVTLERFELSPINIPEHYYFQADPTTATLIPQHEQPTTLHPHPDQPLTEQRVDALIETIENPGTVLTQTNTLSQRVCELLKEHGFDPERFANHTGTPLEQQFYNEIQSIIHDAATMSDSDLSELCKQYAHSAFITVDLAHQFNTQHELEKTAVTLNLGHSIINAAKCYTIACAQGVGAGIYNAGANAYHMIRRPVQTAQSYVESCTHVAQALHDFTTRVLYHDPANPQSRNSFLGRLNHECSELYTFCSDCALTIAQLPPEEIIYHTAAFTVELLASRKITSLIHKTVTVGKAHILDNPTGKKILTALQTSRQNVYKKLEACVQKIKKPLNKSLDTILDTFESSPNIQGSCATLEHAFEKFEHTPGFEHLVNNII